MIQTLFNLFALSLDTHVNGFLHIIRPAYSSKHRESFLLSKTSATLLYNPFWNPYPMAYLIPGHGFDNYLDLSETRKFFLDYGRHIIRQLIQQGYFIYIISPSYLFISNYIFILHKSLIRSFIQLENPHSL